MRKKRLIILVSLGIALLATAIPAVGAVADGPEPLDVQWTRWDQWWANVPGPSVRGCTTMQGWQLGHDKGVDSIFVTEQPNGQPIYYLAVAGTLYRNGEVYCYDSDAVWNDSQAYAYCWEEHPASESYWWEADGEHWVVTEDDHSDHGYTHVEYEQTW